MDELPRPPYSSPLIADNMSLTYPLSKLTSYKALKEYMDKSGLSKELQKIGHNWFWHSEVFEWLFLERLMAQSIGNSFDNKTFDKVFSRAKAEIARSSSRHRYVTILNGIPKFNNAMKLCKNVVLFSVDYSGGSTKLAGLLGVWRFRDSNREPPLWVDEGSCFVVQDFIIPRSNEGRELLELRKRYRKQIDAVIKALKISLDTLVYPKAVYSSHLSSFPFMPISFRDLEELGGIRVEVQDSISKGEKQRIKKIFTLLYQDRLKNQSPRFVSTAINRFANSFRIGQLEQSIVDLIVALEAMIRVSDEELKRRLAIRVSFLLGTNDTERQALYRQISAGYDLRSTIVHGGEKPERQICKALRSFFPELKGKQQQEVLPYLGKALVVLQKVVRLVIRAYIHMVINQTRDEWPDSNDFDYLPFDLKKHHVIQKQLGIKPYTAKQIHKITYWQSASHWQVSGSMLTLEK